MALRTVACGASCSVHPGLDDGEHQLERPRLGTGWVRPVLRIHRFHGLRWTLVLGLQPRLDFGEDHDCRYLAFAGSAPASAQRERACSTSATGYQRRREARVDPLFRVADGRRIPAGYRVDLVPPAGVDGVERTKPTGKACIAPRSLRHRALAIRAAGEFELGPGEALVPILEVIGQYSLTGLGQDFGASGSVGSGIAHDEMAGAVDPLQAVLPMAERARWLAHRLELVEERLEVDRVVPGQVLRLRVRHVIEILRPDDPEAAVERGQVVTNRQAVWPFWKLVAVQVEPPDVLVPVAERLAPPPRRS